MWYSGSVQETYMVVALMGILIRGGSDPTPGIRDLDLFSHLGSVRWDPDLLVYGYKTVLKKIWIPFKIHIP